MARAFSMQMRASCKDYFFDRALILGRMHRANVKRLSRIGAFVRQRGKSILRRRKKVSSAGQPPSVHSRDSFTNLRNILFAANSDWESVVIGPRVVPSLLLKHSNRRTVPSLMELGGRSRITMTLIAGEWIPGDRAKYRSAGAKQALTKEIDANYAPRPFMGPALAAETAAGTLSGVFAQVPM